MDHNERRNAVDQVDTIALCPDDAPRRKHGIMCILAGPVESLGEERRRGVKEKKNTSTRHPKLGREAQLFIGLL